MRLMTGFLLAVVLAFSAAVAVAEGPDGFAGVWRQNIPDSAGKPRSKIPKQLVIKLDGHALMVTMKGPGKVPKVDVTFQLGGPEVTYTGLDGDEFHIRATREGDRLVFDGTENEMGSSLLVHEVWTLRSNSEGDVLVDTKNAKDHNQSPRVSEYERLKQ